MFHGARNQLVAHMALALTQIAIGTPGSVRSLLMTAGILNQEQTRPTPKRSSTSSQSARKRRTRKLHHRQKR
jgi:hypothetical protein